jgi:hypothetical protein
LADKYLSNITVGENASCISSLVISDKTARGGSAAFTVDANQDGNIFIFIEDNVNKQISPVYIDKATTLKGQVNCSSGGVRTTSNYDMDLKTGWNALQVSVEGTTVTYANANSYRGQKWTLLTNSASPMALKTQGLFSQR